MTRFLVSLLLLALGSTALAQNVTSYCPDPLGSILATLDCVEREDAACASAGYNASLFRKLHNGVDTNTTIDEGGMYWMGAFWFVDLQLDYNHQAILETPNMVSLRYVEVVNMTTGVEFGFDACNEYPWGQSYLQHEHAIVTVNDDCQMILWDQYGDNQEQANVDNALDAILADPAVGCRLGMLPADECSDKALTITCEADASPTTAPLPNATLKEKCPPLGNIDSGAWRVSLVISWCTVAVGLFVQW